MHEPERRRLTRRGLLAATGLGALTAIAGCNPFATSARTVTVTAAATSSAPAATRTPPVPVLGLVATTRLHVQQLLGAIAVDSRDRAVLTMLLHDRQAHLAALQAEYARSIGATAPSTEPAPTAAASMPKDPDEVIGRIRADATTAQSMFADALAGASRYQAALYASIAACVATHRMVLA